MSAPDLAFMIRDAHSVEGAQWRLDVRWAALEKERDECRDALSDLVVLCEGMLGEDHEFVPSEVTHGRAILGKWEKCST